MKKRIAFPFFGSKHFWLPWLLPLLPKTHHFCEPFCGSASVTINREPSPIETLNDLNGLIVNFFSVLRDHADDLLRLLQMTPHSHQEFVEAQFLVADPINLEKLTELEKARLFYIIARMSFSGLGGSWGYSVNHVVTGVSSSVARWYNGIPQLGEIALRLTRCQIECMGAGETIQKYDSPDTLFFIDPPYTTGFAGEREAYLVKWALPDHLALAQQLHKIKGKAAVSGYAGVYDNLYYDWHCHIAPERFTHVNNTSGGGTRQEKLWTNYPVPPGGWDVQ